MQEVYEPCGCGSGKKFKFCCNQRIVDMGPKDVIKQAATFPVYDCSIIKNWNENGLASIIVVRQMPNRRYLYGVYVVDYYCLGLKNTFCHANDKWDGVEKLRLQAAAVFPYVEFDYEDARSLIIGSINYAAKLGFKPNKDWDYSSYVVEAAAPYQEKFEYGRNGKPRYIQGPHDDVRGITRKLESTDHDFVLGGPA